MTELKGKPKAQNAQAQSELDKVEKQFEAFDQNLKDLTQERMNAAPKQEFAPPEISQKQMEKTGDIYIKPKRWIADRQKFNEKYREKWNFLKEYVRCIPVHNEMRGERIEMWTHPFGGVGAEEWDIPTGRPVMVPRYVAEQITRGKYHRFTMDQTMRGSDQMGQYYGAMIVDTTVQRIDALPVSNQKSIFMGASNF